MKINFYPFVSCCLAPSSSSSVGKPLIFDARLNWVNRMNGMELDFSLAVMAFVWEWTQQRVRGGQMHWNRILHGPKLKVYDGAWWLPSHRVWVCARYRCGVREPLKCCFYFIYLPNKIEMQIYILCICVYSNKVLSYSILRNGWRRRWWWWRLLSDSTRYQEYELYVYKIKTDRLKFSKIFAVIDAFHSFPFILFSSSEKKNKLFHFISREILWNLRSVTASIKYISSLYTAHIVNFC